jgi:TonB family protein
MTFSGYNVEQRSKEVKALQSFLTYSLIGSVALHVGVLASGIGNFLARVPQEQEEPIEIAIIDPVEEPEKQPEEVPEVKKPEPLPVSRSEPRQSIASSEIAIAPKPQTPITPIRPQSPVVQKPIEKTVPTQKPQPTIQPQQIQTTKPTNTQPPQTQTTQPQVITSNSNSSTNSTIVNQPQATGENSDRLRQLLGGIRNSRATQGSSNTGVESNQSGTTTATSRQQGSPTGGNTNTGTVNSPVATAPTPPRIRTEPSDGNRSLNGRAACRECNTRYPDAARRRGIEGRVEVAVDTDANGNVTNVRVARSSGNRELDEETVRQARNWKLKPAEGGRQGVAIATEFALQGSRRYRQVQEQKKRREAEARNQQTAAANNDAPEGTRRRRRLITTTDANIPAQTSTETRVRRRRESTAETPRQPSTNTNTTSSVTRTNTTRETLRRLRREQTTNNSAQQTSQNTNRRRRRENNTSASQSKLRATLRNLRQPNQSESATPPVQTAPAPQE